MTIHELENELKKLLKGKFSSLTLALNEDNGPNYQTVAEVINEESRFDWVSEEEKQKAIETNCMWTLQWYPDTPISFFALAASSIIPLLTAAKRISEAE